MDNVYLYGERGLVNGILLDNANKAPNALLKQIQWVGETPSFIDEVVRCEYLVEFSLGEFGSPDLIIIAYTADKKYVIFTEAKVVEYKNAVTTKESYADASCLNVQLALKWRFKEALKCNPKDYLRIVEVKMPPAGDKMSNADTVATRKATVRGGESSEQRRERAVWARRPCDRGPITSGASALASVLRSAFRNGLMTGTLEAGPGYMPSCSNRFSETRVIPKYRRGGAAQWGAAPFSCVRKL